MMGLKGLHSKLEDMNNYVQQVNNIAKVNSTVVCFIQLVLFLFLLLKIEMVALLCEVGK